MNRVLATKLHSRQQRGTLLPQRSPSPVPDHQLDASLGRSLQGLVALVCAPAGAVLPVDLQDLVPEAQAGQGGGRVGLHQLHKQTLREEARRGRVSPPGTDGEVEDGGKDGGGRRDPESGGQNLPA